MMWRFLVVVAVLLQGACAAPPRPPTPELSTVQVRADLFTAPAVRVHRFTAAGARVSDAAFAKAVATIGRHIGREIQVIDHGEGAAWGVGGPDAPIQDRGHPVSAADVDAAGGRYMLAEPDRGLLGVIDERSIAGHAQDPKRMLPLVEEGTIIVVELPGPEDGGGVTGLATDVAVGRDPERLSGEVLLFRSAIHRHSNLFVSEAKLAQWTLTHEIGHVLDVPASNTHRWIVPGLGVHCTHPECVMYTGLDWRVVVTGLLKGWPLDFCGLCTGELDRVRENAAAARAP